MEWHVSSYWSNFVYKTVQLMTQGNELYTGGSPNWSIITTWFLVRSWGVLHTSTPSMFGMFFGTCLEVVWRFCTNNQFARWVWPSMNLSKWIALSITYKHCLQACTLTSGKKLLMIYAKQPMKMHKGPTPNKMSHWVKGWALIFCVCTHLRYTVITFNHTVNFLASKTVLTRVL